MRPTPLRESLTQLLRNTNILDPLPTTRELGERFAVANTTVYRELRRLTDAGLLWQHGNGRFYRAEAQQQLDRPQPVACMFRRLELCSALYRELLEGVSQGCGAAQRGMLLWHDAVLVNHPDPVAPPVFAGEDQQRTILANYLDRHGESAGGYLLDHIWSDTVLAEFSNRLKPATLLFRRGDVPGIDNVRADFKGAALLAFGHLLGRGFEHIVPVLPFPHDQAVEQFLEALEDASRDLGCAERLKPRVVATNATQCTALVTRLQSTGSRSALICPEDHISRLLHETIVKAGVHCPREMGLLSAMGTPVARNAGISHLTFDFRSMGRLAVERLGRKPEQDCALEAHLETGKTT